MKKTGVIAGSVHKPPPPPPRRDEWDNPRTDHTSRTNTIATDGAAGGGRPEEATTTRKEAGANADGESRTRTLKKKKKKKRPSVFKSLHQFLLSSFSALCTSDIRSLPYLEKIFISSYIYTVQTEGEIKTAFLKARPSKSSD